MCSVGSEIYSLSVVRIFGGIRSVPIGLLSLISPISSSISLVVATLNENVVFMFLFPVVFMLIWLSYLAIIFKMACSWFPSLSGITVLPVVI